MLTTARWAMSLLNKSMKKPSLLVTNSMLWHSPIPQYFALSMVKTSQRNLVQSLRLLYPEVHVALVNIAGLIRPEDPFFNPKVIGEKLWEVCEKDKEQWTLEVNILGP
jgi:hypothetical protein